MFSRSNLLALLATLIKQWYLITVVGYCLFKSANSRSNHIAFCSLQVTIFQKCRPEFLHDLMLKMRAYIFTPGDLICRRGEVAREMFIIADGVVEILG